MSDAAAITVAHDRTVRVVLVVIALYVAAAAAAALAPFARHAGPDIPGLVSMMAALRSRVISLSLAHQQFMGSADLKNFPLPPFLRALVRSVSNWPRAQPARVQTAVSDQAVMVDLDFAVPFGLLLTEIMTVMIHHGLAGNVMTDCRTGAGKELLLMISHDGDVAVFDTTDTRMISGLNRQLEGQLHLSSPAGAGIEIRLPLPTHGQAGARWPAAGKPS